MADQLVRVALGVGAGDVAFEALALAHQPRGGARQRGLRARLAAAAVVVVVFILVFIFSPLVLGSGARRPRVIAAQGASWWCDRRGGVVAGGVAVARRAEGEQRVQPLEGGRGDVDVDLVHRRALRDHLRAHRRALRAPTAAPSPRPTPQLLSAAAARAAHGMDGWTDGWVDVRRVAHQVLGRLQHLHHLGAGVAVEREVRLAPGRGHLHQLQRRAPAPRLRAAHHRKRGRGWGVRDGDEGAIGGVVAPRLLRGVLRDAARLVRVVLHHRHGHVVQGRVAAPLHLHVNCRPPHEPAARSAASARSEARRRRARGVRAGTHSSPCRCARSRAAPAAAAAAPPWMGRSLRGPSGTRCGGTHARARARAALRVRVLVLLAAAGPSRLQVPPPLAHRGRGERRQPAASLSPHPAVPISPLRARGVHAPAAPAAAPANRRRAYPEGGRPQLRCWRRSLRGR
eukprot:scaffold1238_cov231-Prasinococcus_capsulatus_cf.AAC.5